MGISKAEKMQMRSRHMEPCIAERRVGVALTKSSLGQTWLLPLFSCSRQWHYPCAPSSNQQSVCMCMTHTHDAKASRCSLPSSKETAVTITATISWHALEVVAGLSMSRKNHQCDTELAG